MIDQKKILRKNRIFFQNNKMKKTITVTNKRMFLQFKKSKMNNRLNKLKFNLKIKMKSYFVYI